MTDKMCLFYCESEKNCQYKTAICSNNRGNHKCSSQGYPEDTMRQDKNHTYIPRNDKLNQ